MGDPFRGGELRAAQFSQHILVAEDLLDRIESVPARLEAAEGATQAGIDALVHDVSVCWQNAWEQLQGARAVVASNGRDVGAFDAARADAGDLWYGAADGKAVQLGDETHVTYRNVRTEPARRAIAILRAAMPEVVVTKPAELEVDLRPASNKLIELAQIAGGILVLLGIGYVLYRAFT